MKKIFTTIMAVAATCVVGFAQTNVDNGTLESWTTATGGPNGDFEDLPGPFLKTLNSLYNLPAVLGGPGPLTTTKTTDKCEGTYAAQMTSKSFQGIFIPGAMGTFDVSLAPPGAKLGKPYTDKPTHVTYCYKYSPVANDSAEVFCVLSKWNGTSRDTIAYGNKKYFGVTASYTSDNFALTYYDTQTTPDTCTLLCVASAGYNFAQLTSSAGQVNSTLYIDNLQFDFTNSVNENVAATEIKVFPSPATDVLNIWVGENATKATYRIFDLTGRTLLSGNAMPQNNVVNIASLPVGTYWVEVAGTKGTIATKQIQKQ